MPPFRLHQAGSLCEPFELQARAMRLWDLVEQRIDDQTSRDLIFPQPAPRAPDHRPERDLENEGIASLLPCQERAIRSGGGHGEVGRCERGLLELSAVKAVR